MASRERIVLCEHDRIFTFDPCSVEDSQKRAWERFICHANQGALESEDFIAGNLLYFFQRLFPVRGNWFDISRKTKARRRMELEFLSFRLGVSRYENWRRYLGKDRVSYTKPVIANVRLNVYECSREDGREYLCLQKDESVHILDLPVMTPETSFVINGIERVVLMQMVRSPGVYVLQDQLSDERNEPYLRIIPRRGPWIEIHYVAKGQLRFVLGGDKRNSYSLGEMMCGVRNETGEQDIHAGIAEVLGPNDPAFEVLSRLVSAERSKRDSEDCVKKLSILRDCDYYDLGVNGRRSLNRRLNRMDTGRLLCVRDVIGLAAFLVACSEKSCVPDDIDHLGHKIVRCVGEQLLDLVLVPEALRLKRAVGAKMSFEMDRNLPETLMPRDLIDFSRMQSLVNDFFFSKAGVSSTSQYMDQTNLLSAQTHKRRVTVLGAGGLVRKNAGFEVRDVHHSFYGKICPIETPEGANIGLVSSLASCAKINDVGRIVTPYYVVERGEIRTDILEWLDPFEEESCCIASYYERISEGQAQNGVLCRFKGEVSVVSWDDVTHIEALPQQILSYSAALIPFIEHDDANRALMGANMQRQAVPLLRPDLPIVGTGMEAVGAGVRTLTCSSVKGEVVHVGPESIAVLGEDGKLVGYSDEHIRCSNQGTVLRSRPRVSPGEIVDVGTMLSESSGTRQGELCLGQNVLVAFMPFDGLNFEDAIVVSERFAQNDAFRSLHVEEYRVHVRETRFGEEELTQDIPNISHESLKNLDECGIVKVGSRVRAGDLLCGKITPKGAWEELLHDADAETKLIHAIFGKKSEPYDDTSLRLPTGCGVVVSVDVMDADKNGLGSLESLRDLEKRRKACQVRYHEQCEKLRDKRRHYEDLPAYVVRIVQKEMQKAAVGIPELESFCTRMESSANPDTIGFLLDEYCGLMSDIAFENHEDFCEVQKQIVRQIDPEILEINLKTLADRQADIDREYQDEIHKIDERMYRLKLRNYSELPLNSEFAQEVWGRYREGVKETIRISGVKILRLDNGQELYSGSGDVPDSAVDYINDAIQTGIIPVDKELSAELKSLWSSYQDDLSTLEREYWDAQAEKDDVLLPPGVLKTVVIRVLVDRPLQVGDKLAGRHGNKGVVSKILPQEDMPRMSDGTSVDVVLNPLGVPSRMNIGQILETMLGWAGKELGVCYTVPSFAKLSESKLSELMIKARMKKLGAGMAYTDLTADDLLSDINHTGQVWLYDGRTGERFDHPVTTGYMYMLKLNHMVDDKMHARSVGPYANVTQQPLAGRANNGGQRLGEMEVWALEAYGAAYTLRELLTVKSDDVDGRRNMYKRLVNGYNGLVSGIPESFFVLQKELQSLGLNFELLTPLEK